MNTDLLELSLYGCVDGIGRRTLRKVVEYRSARGWSWRELWVPSEEVVQYLSLSAKSIAAIQSADSVHWRTTILSALEQGRFRLIGTEDTEYPPLLKEADDPPPVLFVKGAVMVWSASSIPIAIVGTRNMTAYGRSVTEKVVTELVQLGCVIISGLMYGVDTTAHLSAVSSEGKTVAVLGYGFDHCYPPEHQSNLDTLLKKGATFVSEYPPWKIAKRGNFPARNSIVAGMSAAVVVTEAAAKSGSMITAQCALDDGRAVCAVPGPITNPYCEGTKWLINEGATLVTSGNDVLEQIYAPTARLGSSFLPINPLSTKFQTAKPRRPAVSTAHRQLTFDRRAQATNIGQQLLAELDQTPLSIDQLAHQLALSPAIVATEVSLLELQQLVVHQAGSISVM